MVILGSKKENLLIDPSEFKFWFCSFVCYFLFLQENQDLLIKCISQDLGFTGGKPIAACVIYKCLLHWRSFEVERTSVFDRIIQSIASAIEVLQLANDIVACCCNLQNSCALWWYIWRTTTNCRKFYALGPR